MSWTYMGKVTEQDLDEMKQIDKIFRHDCHKIKTLAAAVTKIQKLTGIPEERIKEHIKKMYKD